MPSPSLPPTVAARRNARLKQAALSAIPFLLYLLAAGLRLWAPDLVPFGGQQAKYFAEASARAPVGFVAAYADPTVTPLTLVEPVLRQLPAPVLIWVGVRGLLDSLGVVLLFLAGRPLVGLWGAVLAALLYAVNPAVWLAARDPAGPMTAVVMAAALWTAVRFVERPTLMQGAVFGMALGLLARSGPAGLIVVPLGAVTLALGRASWRVGGVTALVLVIVGGPALYSWLPALRWETVALGYPLALPAWLVEHHAYPYLSGWLYRWASQSYISIPWFPSDDMRAQYALMWAVSPTTALLLSATGVSLYEAWRGRTRLLLPLLWAVVWLFVAYPRRDSEINATLTSISFLLSFVGPLALSPVLALLMSVLLAARPAAVQWGGAAGLVLLLAAGVYSLGHEMQAATGSEWRRQAFTEPPWEAQVLLEPALDSYGPLSWGPSLREVWSVARATQDGVDRVGGNEIVRVAANAFTCCLPDAGPLQPPGRPLRQMPQSVLVLPLERETAYLTSSGRSIATLPQTIELSRPTTSSAVFTVDGADTGARIVTLRPRPTADWLARATAVPAGRFVDGSVLLGVVQTSSSPGIFNYALYWHLPAAADGRNIGERYQLQFQGERSFPGSGPPGQELLPIETRRGGELVVVLGQAAYEHGVNLDTPVTVTIYDAKGGPIPLMDGSQKLELPLRVQIRCDLTPGVCVQFSR